MKKIMLATFFVSLFVVTAFAVCVPWFPQTCKSNFVWNEEKGCYTYPNIRVNGEPVCVSGL
ncbi:hypothetical protein CSPB12327_04400 [Campylobacter sp. RM12327]|nr:MULTISPECIES: hypothetical protein [Campylobacter]ASM37614.1 hypothetical protein CSF_1787 [Campylobacter sputorum bv. faecalis CCUG 20703]MBE7358444.1 hypothetical protein [Campylobacter sp. RM11302]MBF6669381.1 hypothetical protein [Campylobacter sp. RM12327]MBF6674649.1 hypothetical protein [Campylobacter sp. RM13538]MBF6675676.1 hypothetical protein [Campylobacter sp. RM12321]